MFNPKEAIIQAILKALLENKDEYIERAKDELLKFLGTLDVNDNDKPDLEEAKEKVAKLAEALKEAYVFVVGLVEKAKKDAA